MKLGKYGTIAGCTVAALGTLQLAASAQTVQFNPVPTAVPVPGDSRGVLRQYDDAYFSNSHNFFENRSLGGQTKFLIGPFVENEIGRDGRDVFDTYQRTLARQTSAGPVIRTIDLPNPFNQSIRTSLATDNSTSLQPLPPVIDRTPTVPPAITPTPPDTRTPVPALW